MVARLPEASDLDLAGAAPWDRQDAEPSRACAAFRLFKDSSPTQRSFSGIVEASGYSERRLRELGVTWEWKERVAAWDEARHHIEDTERLDAIRSMHAIHRQAGRAALDKAVRALLALDVADMTPGTIARMMELGAKLERSTLIVSVEELQGIEVEADEEDESPWERIARELDPATAEVADH